MKVELYVTQEGESERALRSRIAELGCGVIVRMCPPTAAQWVEFPFVRLSTGSSFYGVEGVEDFLRNAGANAARSPSIGACGAF